MSKLDDKNMLSELSPKWHKYYLCGPSTYPFKLVVRGVERTIKSYSDHSMIIRANCERYDAEEKARKNNLTK